MKLSIRHIKAICMKELKDYYKNPLTLLVLIVPFLLFFIFFLIHTIRHGDLKSFSTVLPVLLDYNISFSCVIFPSFYIVEEKEKKTLDVLILSGISPLEFLCGKMFPTVFITMLTSISMLILSKINFIYLPSLCILFLIITMSEVILMSLIGIIAENNIQVLIYSLPFIFILMYVPILSFSNISYRINSFINISNMNFMIKNILNGNGFFYSEYSLLVIFIWLIVPSIFFILLYKTKKLY